MIAPIVFNRYMRARAVLRSSVISILSVKLRFLPEDNQRAMVQLDIVIDVNACTPKGLERFVEIKKGKKKRISDKQVRFPRRYKSN